MHNDELKIEEITMDFGDIDNIDFDLGNDTNITFEIEGNDIGTTNYNYLSNKPQINDVELIGNKKSKELKLQDEMDVITNQDIEDLLNLFV